MPALRSYGDIDQAKVDRLVTAFNGAIKYTPMVKDHPDWTDEQCLAFAREWHAVAIERLRQCDARLWGAFGPNGRWAAWNEGIPYCRNFPTRSMFAEAGAELIDKERTNFSYGTGDIIDRPDLPAF